MDAYTLLIVVWALSEFVTVTQLIVGLVVTNLILLVLLWKT